METSGTAQLTPVRLEWRGGQPVLLCCDFGDAAFTEPLFAQSCLKLQPRALVEVGLEELRDSGEPGMQPSGFIFHLSRCGSTLVSRLLSTSERILVLAEPAPMCTVEQLGESNVVLRVFGWVDQKRNEFLKVRSEAIRLVKGAFDRAGIVMPEPIYNVRLGQAQTSAPGAEAPAPTSTVRPATTAKRAPSEPEQAIDIAPRGELDEQIDAERRIGEEDLLAESAPKE